MSLPSPDAGVLAAIGHTPLVRLPRFLPEGAPALFAKLEFTNPGGSVKDRIARYMLVEALRTGRLAPGDTVVEFSSGNTAIGIAMAAAALGLRALLVIAAKTSQEKTALLRAYGAEVVRAEAGLPPDHPDHGYHLSRRLARERGAFYFDQYHSPLNPQAHYLTTGPEIWRQMEGRIDVLVAGIGTGGTLSGTARFLREQQPDLHVVAVDARGSIFADYLAGRPVGAAGSWEVEEIGNDMLCRALDPSVVDEVITVPDDEATATAARVARREGLCVGGSSGAALAAVEQVVRGLPASARVVTILPDAGDRYLSKFGATAPEAPACLLDRTSGGA